MFRFCKAEKNATYGLGYKLPLQRNSDDHVLSHRAGDEAAHLVWVGGLNIKYFRYVPLYIPKIPPQKLRSEHIVSRAAMELSYIRRSFYTKKI